MYTYIIHANQVTCFFNESFAVFIVSKESFILLSSLVFLLITSSSSTSLLSYLCRIIKLQLTKSTNNNGGREYDQNCSWIALFRYIKLLNWWISQEIIIVIMWTPMKYQDSFRWWKFCIKFLYLSHVKISRLLWLLQSRPIGNYHQSIAFFFNKLFASFKEQYYVAFF